MRRTTGVAAMLRYDLWKPRTMQQRDFFNNRRSNTGLVSRRWLILALVIGSVAAVVSYFANDGRDINKTGYTVTETTVYYAGVPIKTADPGSFRVLSTEHEVAIDDDHVYCRDEIMSHIERRSFAVIDREGTYMRDAKRVFYLRPDTIIQGADPTSFTRLTAGQLASEFWRDANSVYIWGRRIAGADPSTFTPLTTKSYARDQDRIYSGDQVMRRADAATFEVLFEDSRGRPTYARDREHVFYNEQIVQGADPTTFKVLQKSKFARDAEHLYYAGVANFAALDLDHLHIGGWFVRDDTRVYLVPHDPDDSAPLFPEAKARALASIGSDDNETWGYASDGVHVYYYNCRRNKVELLAGADPKTFEVIKTDYRGDMHARDDESRYFNEKRIE